MFVRIDHNGIGSPNLRECAFRLCIEIFRQDKIPAVSSVRMNPESVPLAESENLRKRVHGTSCRSSHRCHHRSHVPMFQPFRERVYIHATKRVGGHGFERQLQHSADSSVRVMRLLVG